MSDEIPLRNDHYVYILGAGYSVARGLPLINSFLNKMRDAALWCEGAGRSDESSAIRDVLKFRLSAAAAAYRVPIDLENIEELFSLASAADPKISRSVKISIAATLAYCCETSPDPELSIPPGNSAVLDLVPFASPNNRVGGATDQIIGLYDAFAVRLLGLSGRGQSSIVSFNYDDLVERSIEKIGARFHYGFSGRHEVRPGVPYSHDGIAILKLHGSINWAYPGARGRMFTVFKDYSEVYAAGLVPEIVPPTWNKTIADRLAEVWFTAIDKLSTATKIVIIGFSMPKTDLHFKYLLAAGLKNNFSLREIVFVDPSATIKERASEVLAEREIDKGRVRFIESGLSDLIGTRTSPAGDRYSFNGQEGRPY